MNQSLHSQGSWKSSTKPTPESPVLTKHTFGHLIHIHYPSTPNTRQDTGVGDGDTVATRRGPHLWSSSNGLGQQPVLKLQSWKVLIQSQIVFSTQLLLQNRLKPQTEDRALSGDNAPSEQGASCRPPSGSGGSGLEERKWSLVFKGESWKLLPQ